jgi:hypothetical protein
MDATQKQELVDLIAQLQQTPHAPFPYLIVRLMPAVYGVAPLPATLARERLIALAQHEHRLNARQLSMCVVFGLEDAVYIRPDGTPSPGPRPWGGRPVPWTLGESMVGPEVSRARH